MLHQEEPVGFHEGIKEITSAAIETVEEMIYCGEVQTKFVHAFGTVWKFTVEKASTDEVRALSVFVCSLVVRFT